MLLKARDLPTVMFSPMNEVHLRELKILNDLYREVELCNSEKVELLLDLFLEDVREHFRFEESLMERSHFFAYHLHREEHNRMLSLLENLKKEWKSSKDCSRIVRFLNRTFLPWLVEHIKTMDSATADYLIRHLTLNK